MCLMHYKELWHKLKIGWYDTMSWNTFWFSCPFVLWDFYENYSFQKKVNTVFPHIVSALEFFPLKEGLKWQKTEECYSKNNFNSLCSFIYRLTLQVLTRPLWCLTTLAIEADMSVVRATCNTTIGSPGMLL